ncbi:MAG: MotA/TolQ/ExbB proton channel family protein [Magnetococcales bacterium]|nr:MotA/TolQ/ExbB proton channel family protein [Magnetococcales bacterium]
MMTWGAWWHESDLVVQGVLVVLVLASLSSWSVILYKWWQLAKAHGLEKRLNQALSKPETDLSPSLLEGHFLSLTLHPSRSPQTNTRQALEADLAQGFMERRIHLENGLTWLATIGSSAPFIGLFGTVWGIMHALQGLGGEAAISMDLVAGPVSEALVATAVGLFAAIPAVMGYNALIRRLRRVTTTMQGNILHVINRLTMTQPRPQPASTPLESTRI